MRSTCRRRWYDQSFSTRVTHTGQLTWCSRIVINDIASRVCAQLVSLRIFNWPPRRFIGKARDVRAHTGPGVDL